MIGARLSSRIVPSSQFRRGGGTLSAWLVGGAFAALLVGCGGTQKKSDPLASLRQDNTAIDRSKCDDRGKQIVVADANQDKKPDVWKLYENRSAGGQKVQALACKQVDLNYDGKVDMVSHYDATGPVTFEEMDLDFDGRFDLWAFYSSGKKVREEKDMNFDRRADFTEYFEAGKVVRVERDTNFDGKVDEWQYFENGRLDRIGYDTTGSGRVDKWDRSPEGAESSAPAEGAAPAGDGAAPPAGTPATGTQPPAAAAQPASPAATTPAPAATAPAPAPAATTAAKKK